MAKYYRRRRRPKRKSRTTTPPLSQTWSELTESLQLWGHKPNAPWQIVIDGTPDPRKFRNYREFRDALEDDVWHGRIPPEADVRVRRMTEESHKPTIWQAFIWAVKRLAEQHQ